MSKSRSAIAATVLLAAVGIGLVVWWIGFSVDDEVAALALAKDACDYEEYQYYDTEEEFAGTEYDIGRELTIQFKIRYSPTGFHGLGRMLADSHSEFGQEEFIHLYDVGRFTRKWDTGTSTTWGDWNVQYWSEGHKEARRNNLAYFMVHSARFCGYTNLQNLKYVGDDTIDGEAVKHFTAEVPLKVEHGYGPDDYELVEFWLDLDGKLLRKQIEVRQTSNGFDYHYLHTIDYSELGVPNKIVAPNVVAVETPEPYSEPPLQEQVPDLDPEGQLTEALQKAGKTPEEIEEVLEHLDLTEKRE